MQWGKKCLGFLTAQKSVLFISRFLDHLKTGDKEPELCCSWDFYIMPLTLEISCTHCLNVNLSHKISGLWGKSTLLKFIGASWDTNRGYAKVKCFIGVTAPIPIEAFCAIYYKHPEDSHGKICHTVNWCQIKVKRLYSFASKSFTKDHSIFLQKWVISGNIFRSI